MMKQTTSHVALAMAAAGLLAACSAAPSTTPPAQNASPPAANAAVDKVTLTNTRWSITGGTGTAVQAILKKPGEPLQLFLGARGEIGIANACNHIGGRWHADGDTLRISELVSTLMACEDQALMAAEAGIATWLDQPLSVTITGNTMTLRAANGDTLVWTRGAN